MPAAGGFGVWTKGFGGDFEEVVSGLGPGGDGAKRLDGIQLDPGPYPRGAAWWVAVATEDHKVAAFARVVPYPIVARDGSCSLSLELISLHGNRFIASGSGFPPGQDVEVETRASGTVSRKRQRVYADGALPLDVLEHGTLVADTLARYSIKAGTCAPAVEYRWGEPALLKER
jgi:hypothetical protein